MAATQGRLGILVGGGPAPGINSTISAATIEAVNSGLEVVGIYDGYQYLMEGRVDRVRPLTIPDVSLIHFQGGSILRTSRSNPTRSAEELQRTLHALRDLGIAYLITIGGDDTAFAAYEVAKAANGAFRVAHVPKTIDNDLPLPGGMSTFGFETARHLGTELVLNLMEDSRTTNRWIIVVVMGRRSGHLALGIGKAAGATFTIIPEEFPTERVSLKNVCGIIEGAILKRRVMGHEYGLAIVGEGIGEKLDTEELAEITGSEMGYDAYGNLRLGDIPLATIIKRDIQQRFAQRGEKLSVADVTLGYELRCARPIPFDIDYTRTLGYGAIRFLLSEPADERLRYGGLVCVDDGRLHVLSFDEIQDPVTGRIRARLVDTDSEHYNVAREYMIRLEARDFQDPKMLSKLAAAANITPAEFESRFAHVTSLNGSKAPTLTGTAK
ncbi:MAG: 6-phosphofructokinase [Dehalococcoidia bacterium]|nr:6-phosphofructokinase [Dehalococcoidia bacterium]